MAKEEFVIRLAVNSSGVTTGVNTAIGQIQRLHADLTRVVEGFLALRGVQFGARLIKDAIDLGGHLNDMADRSNMSVEGLQAIEFAAKQSGGSLDGVVRGMKDMARAQIDAIKGNAELRAAFARYGIDLETLKRTDPERLFMMLASALGSAQATAQVTDDVAQILGKSGDELLPAFRNGFAESTEKAKELGLVLKRDVTDELDRAGDEIDILKEKFQKMTASVVASGIRAVREHIRNVADVIIATDISKRANEAVGGGTTGSIVESIISKLIFGELKNAQNLADEEEKKQRENRKQNAPGNVQKATEGNLAPNVKPDSDALARIGGYRGGGSSEIQRVLPQQLSELRQANRHLQRIVQVSEKGFADGVRDPQARALLQRVDNYFRYGIDFDTDF